MKKVVHKVTGEYRAMKIIAKKNVSSEYVKQMLNEIEILKQMDHPNIVRLYEFYQEKEQFILVTEYIEGGELFDRIAKVKFFTEVDAAKIMK